MFVRFRVLPTSKLGRSTHCVCRNPHVYTPEIKKFIHDIPSLMNVENRGIPLLCRIYPKLIQRPTRFAVYNSTPWFGSGKWCADQWIIDANYWQVDYPQIRVEDPGVFFSLGSGSVSYRPFIRSQFLPCKIRKRSFLGSDPVLILLEDFGQRILAKLLILEGRIQIQSISTRIRHAVPDTE